MAPNDTAYKRWICHSGHKLLCKLCRTFPPPEMGGRFTVFFWQAGHAAPLDGWRCSSQKRVISRLIQIRQAQYTDTWTCHLHRESKLTTHIDITPPTPPDPGPNPLPTPHLRHPHHRNQITDTRPTLPLFPQDW